MKQNEVMFAEEKRATHDDLPRQFEAGFEKVKNLYCQLFDDSRLDPNQASSWHKQENEILLPLSDDKDEDAGGDETIDGADD